MMELLLAAQLFSTLFMTGLIWFVQVVHYPLYAMIGSHEFPAYQERHQRLTTLVVGPVMLLEATTAVAWIYRPPAAAETLTWVALGLLLIIWLSTAALQVPAHGRLTEQYSDAVHRRLVQTNWIRTVAWTCRSLIVLWLMLDVLRSSVVRSG